ncbi:hypothetical protein L1987_09660 [Smallanthus sonchifolius]|uniref:Uncharacterized protein n=1 Tax=Smallanthus sonchifolius TaxID=185202 RepID=A0ACB9JQ69_9ASTR|nr:hypothetical protein L1987_09660 [Smallanthus sonchifolius]
MKIVFSLKPNGDDSYLEDIQTNSDSDTTQNKVTTAEAKITTEAEVNIDASVPTCSYARSIDDALRFSAFIQKDGNGKMTKEEFEKEEKKANVTTIILTNPNIVIIPPKEVQEEMEKELRERKALQEEVVRRMVIDQDIALWLARKLHEEDIRIEKKEQEMPGLKSKRQKLQLSLELNGLSFYLLKALQFS